MTIYVNNALFDSGFIYVNNPFLGNPDTEANRFSLGSPVTKATTCTTHTARPFFVSGATDGIDLAISVVSGEYRIDGGAWTSLSGFVRNGQLVEFRVTASDLPFTAVRGELHINEISSSFYVVTGKNVGAVTGCAFFVRDYETKELVTNTTVDIKIASAQFGGALLYEADALAIGSDGYLVIPLAGGEIGLQVFISGVLANGKYIAGATGIIDLAGA